MARDILGGVMVITIWGMYLDPVDAISYAMVGLFFGLTIGFFGVAIVSALRLIHDLLGETFCFVFNAYFRISDRVRGLPRN